MIERRHVVVLTLLLSGSLALDPCWWAHDMKSLPVPKPTDQQILVITTVHLV